MPPTTPKKDPPKKPAKAEPPKKEAPPAPMDKKEVSKMLGYIKYHARPGNKNEEGRRDAEECLNVYTKLKNIDKAAFLAKFENNKGSLKWIYSYNIRHQAEESTDASSTENWYTKCSMHGSMYILFAASLTPKPPRSMHPPHSIHPTPSPLRRHQLLKMHGFDAMLMKQKESDEVLQALLLENQTEFKYEPQVKESISGNPLLTRYWFVVNHGVKRTKLEREKHDLSASSDLKEKDIREAGSVPFVSVKLENPLFAVFKEKRTVLQSAKAALDKIHAQSQDIYCQLKASKDELVQCRAKSTKDIVDQLGEHLSETRMCCAQMADVDGSDDHLQKHIDRMQNLIDKAAAHQEGFKSLKRKSTMMLSS